MSGQRLQGIVFDKDGTLFDFACTWEGWAQNFLARAADGPETACRMGQAIGFDTASGQFDRESVVIAGTPRQIAEALAAYMAGHSLADIVAFLNAEAAQATRWRRSRWLDCWTTCWPQGTGWACRRFRHCRRADRMCIGPRPAGSCRCRSARYRPFARLASRSHLMTCRLGRHDNARPKSDA